MDTDEHEGEGCKTRKGEYQRSERISTLNYSIFDITNFFQMGMAIVDGGFDRPPELRKVLVLIAQIHTVKYYSRQKTDTIHCRILSGTVQSGSHSMQRIRPMTMVMEREE